MPPGHEEWAKGRLGVVRWTAILLLFEAVVWLGLYVGALIASGGFHNPWSIWLVAGFFAVIAPVSAVYYSSKARRALGIPR